MPAPRPGTSAWSTSSVQDGSAAQLHRRHGRDLEQQFELDSERRNTTTWRARGWRPRQSRSAAGQQDWNFIGVNRTGYSNTHSGQVEVERRFSKGVAFQWFYTFTRSLTTTDSGGFEVATPASIRSAAAAGSPKTPDPGRAQFEL